MALGARSETGEVVIGRWILDLTPDDVGKTFIASPSTITDYSVLDFDVIRSIVTNGNLDNFSATLTPAGLGGQGQGTAENNWFYTGTVAFVPTLLIDPALTNGIDLGGLVLGHIVVDVNSLTMLADPTGNESFFEGTFTVTFVPEPPPLALLSATLFGIGALVVGEALRGWAYPSS